MFPETEGEQDRRLLESKDANAAKIRRGIDQLDKGEGIPEDQLDAWRAQAKSPLPGLIACSTNAPGNP
jgi:hypothetical protein